MASTQVLRKALSILTEGQSAPIAKSLKPFAEKMRSDSKPWTQGKGIQGMGIGQKISDGKKQKHVVLKVYVERKMPKSKLKNMVPAKVKIPGIDGSLETDVQEIGKVQIEPNTIKLRPTIPGFGVGHLKVTVGTFGCLVRRNGDKTGLYILSNSHVLANEGVAKKGDVIIQPGKHDDGTSADKIAKLFDWVPFQFTASGFPNTVDAAIAKVNKKSDVVSAIRLIGIPKGISKVVRRGMKVQKTGRTTDYTIGEITDTDYRLALTYKKTSSTSGRVGLSDQVLCTRYTAGGDSGSAVLNMSQKVVGLHFAGSPSTSIFNKIQNVVDLLDVAIVTKKV